MSINPGLDIFDKHYWRRPTPKAQGATSPNVLYQAVGEALSQWELCVDQKLADLFVVFVCEPGGTKFTENAARRGYGSIMTAGRREAIRVAAESFFPPWITDNQAEKDGLRKIVTVIGPLAASLRDDIAHGVGVENIERDVYEGGPEPKIVGEQHLGSFLMPPEYNTHRTFAHRQKGDHVADLWKARYCYNVDDINEIKWKFYYYGLEITNYIRLVTPYVERVRKTERDLEKLKRAVRKISSYPGSGA